MVAGARWEGEPPSAVLVDLRRGARQAGTISALRCDGRFDRLPILALVDDDDDSAIRDALGAGADDFLRFGWLERELPIRLIAQEKAFRVRQELLSRERDLATLVELTRAFAGTLDRNGLPHEVTRRLAAELRLRRCSIVLLEEGGRGRIAASSDDDTPGQRTIDLSRYPEILRALECGSPVVVDDPREHPLLDSVRDSQAAIPGGLAVLPLLWEGVPLGVLVLRADGVRTFSPRELDFAATVANATSVALHNLRILAERERIEGELSETRRKLEGAARQAMIVELAGAAAHELNQPLTSIVGWSEILLRKLPEGDPQARPLTIIGKEAERMAEVVRKLGRITRHETTEYVGATRILDLDKATEGS